MSTSRARMLLLAGEPLATPVLATLTRLRYQPVLTVTDTKLTTEQLVELIEENQIGLILVAGYGKILKAGVLDAVAGQVLNIHPSLLPEYRGPSPVVSAILNGELETGVTLIELDTEMDHGPIIAQHTHRCSGMETADELHTLLATIGTELFVEHVDAYLDDSAVMLRQQHDDATYCTFFQKADGNLAEYHAEPEYQERMVRAFSGWPTAWIETKEHGRLIVHKAQVIDGQFMPVEVQPAGKQRMSFAAFAAGKRTEPRLLASEIFPSPKS
jgi:methionyl-tRNA formyltransferase